MDKKILLIDEAWSLLRHTKDSSYIFEMVKTCRKFNMGLLLINQEVEGLLTSEAGKSVLANSSYTVLLRQKPAVIDQIQKSFSERWWKMEWVDQLVKIYTAYLGEKHSECNSGVLNSSGTEFGTAEDNILDIREERK